MRKTKVLVKKEIMDILRDKKTLIVMIVLPLLLYPLLLIGMTLGVNMFMESQSGKVHTVSFAAGQERIVQELQKLYENNRGDISAQLTFAVADDGDVYSAEGADLAVEVTDDGGRQRITLHYDSTEQDSRYACEALEEVLDLYREKLLTKNLQAKGLTEEFLHPITVEAEDGASKSESFGMDIGGSIGMMLIVTIMMGAMYPAIDATAGEKERGTLETLLTLPVSNFELIMSKYITVALFACVTAVISLLSLGGSVVLMMSSVSEELKLQIPQLSTLLPIIPIVLLTMIATALFITALTMCFCVFARSFKEANNYITPVMLVVMFASMVAMIPTVRLDYRTALIPVVNVSLMVKQIIAQQFSLPLAGMTILVNLGYSVLIVWVLSKIYNSEDVLFSDGFRSFRLFQRRGDIKAGTVPQMGDVAVIVTVVFLLLIYVGTAATVRLGLGGVALQQLFILAVPMLAVWYMKSDARELLSLKRPRLAGAAGGALLYLGMYAMIMVLSVFLTRFLPEASAELVESYDMLTRYPLPLMLLVMAAMPAVGEELLFRGFVMGSIRHKYGVYWAMLLSAAIFGLFHMSLVKFLPTGLLGLCFAVIVWRSGSIYIGMFLHFVNNAVSFLTIKYPQQAAKLVPFLTKESLSAQENAALLAVGIVLAAAGWMILRRSGSEDGAAVE